MGVWKINPNDISSIKRTPKELSLFWRTYFSSISIEFSKLYFKYYRQNIPVQMVSRDIVRAKDYFNDLKSNSIIKPFQILPHGELGFIHFPDELANDLINRSLGGQSQAVPHQHEMTATDLSILEHQIQDMLQVLQSQFLDDNRQIAIELIDDQDVLLYANSLQSEQLISLQQFSVQLGTQAYIFTIGIANRLLEQFVQL